MALAGADLTAAALALFFVIVVFGGGDRLTPFDLLLVIPIVGLMKLKGLYDRDEHVIRKSTMDEAPQLFEVATFIALVFYVLQDPLVDNGDLGAKQMLGLWLGFGLALIVLRASARRLVGRLSPKERVLVVGDNVVASRLRGKVDGRMPVEVIGSIPLEHADATDVNLRALTSAVRVDRLVIAPAVSWPQDRTNNLIRTAKATGCRVSLMPGVHDVVGAAVVFDDVHGMTMLGVQRFGLSRSSWRIKRSMDAMAAGLGLLFTAPVMAVIALVIKLDSPGPVFFRQARVGRDGQVFQIVKFRSMTDGADAQRAALMHLNEAGAGLFKIADDPRITRVGRVLRKTCLDELPQLINVFRGEMSLVGPRPLIADEDRLIEGHDRQRLQLTPGMTGPWQVLADAQIPLHEMAKIDYLYLAGWSPWRDLTLIARTVLVMSQRGSR